MDVTIIGLSNIGLVNAAVLASFGHQVTGYDVNSRKIDFLNQGIPLLTEPGLKKILFDNKERIIFTNDIQLAFKKPEIIMIAVDVSEMSDGSCDLTNINQVVKSIINFSTCDSVIVIRSNVPVGVSKQISTMLNMHSQYKYEIVCNPDFSIKGDAVRSLLFPERVIIGVKDVVAHVMMNLLYEQYSLKNVPLYFTSPESAEMIKYASDNFLAVKSSYINEIALLCDRYGADVEMVAQGMEFDSRIGKGFLKAGLGFASTKIPKEDKTGANSRDNIFEMLQAMANVNRKMPLIFANRIIKRFSGSLKDKTIAVLGLSTNGNSSDVQNSQAIPLINCLLDAEAKIIAYDKYAETEFENFIGKKKRLKYAIDLKTAIRRADCVVIANNAEEFAVITESMFKEMMINPPVIFDGRNIYNPSKMTQIEYYSIGRPLIHRYIEKGPERV